MDPSGPKVHLSPEEFLDALANDPDYEGAVERAWAR